ncbi:hypothetical protein BO71DRAFT_403248, partial [Aspergillus ellipticus CBS 707.79]
MTTAVLRRPQRHGAPPPPLDQDQGRWPRQQLPPAGPALRGGVAARSGGRLWLRHRRLRGVAHDARPRPRGLLRRGRPAAARAIPDPQCVVPPDRGARLGHAARHPGLANDGSRRFRPGRSAVPDRGGAVTTTP